ncbi:hypothetical protein [uncultured Croceitalea sp.]|uniref:hypothetical protein n=1 Tax=uncultured Croceitalea sp. TaxID=1798908 RepID=UPI00374F6AE2
MLLIAVNTVGVESNELGISYIQEVGELSKDEFKEGSYENVSLVMTKKKEKNWLIKDLNSDRNAILEILDSEITLHDKSDVKMKFDDIDFKEFQFKDRDTIYDKSGLKQFEILRSKRQRIIKIHILDQEKVQGINHVQIHY